MATRKTKGQPAGNGQEKIRAKDALGRDRVGMLLYTLYAVILVVSVIIVAKIIRIQLFWTPERELVALYSPRPTRVPSVPMRGSILSHDGCVMAVTAPAYEIYMDPTVRLEEFAGKKEAERAEAEATWRAGARAMCDTIALLYGDATKNADWYYRQIIAKRERNGRGDKYLLICKQSSFDDYSIFRTQSFVQKGPNKSGVICKRIGVRQYPYRSIARSTIGRFGVEGSTDVSNIEVQMDRYLSGTAGYEYVKRTDRGRKIHDYDSTSVEVVDGFDVRTTLDMKLQLMVDTTLRMHIDTIWRIEAASAILLDVHTGAVRAMVNLTRDSEGTFRENVNNLFKRSGEPGSVFKSVATAAAMSYGYVNSVEETIPTNHGRVGVYRQDDHITKFERDSLRTEIPLSEGLKISSNYVFTYLILKYFGGKPQEYYTRLHEWNLDAAIKTDIGETLTPQLRTPGDPAWSPTDLGAIGYGYSIGVTPMHIATFYNGIANGGLIMRPYFIEDVEQDGEPIEQFGPQEIGRICSPELAADLARGLTRVTEPGGTATRLGKAPYKVAAKTGTSRIYIHPSERGGSTSPYESADGRRKNQGTVVCFFPADDPQYTLLITMYSSLTRKPLYGGVIPAAAARDIITRIHASAPATQGSSGVIPTIEAPEVEAEAGKVPDVRTLSLMDALYEMESRGYKVNYSGIGQVAKQSPAPGSNLAAGGIVTLTLK